MDYEQIYIAVAAMNERQAKTKLVVCLRALNRIAAYDDKGANARLERTGSFSSFDEPGSVEIARTALEIG